MIKLCDIPPEAAEKLPPAFTDKSGIGVHFVDTIMKAMKVKLEDGTRVSCKRRGLRLDLRVGKQKGSGLMRRLEVSPDPVIMLRAALEEAAKEAEVGIQISDTEIHIEPKAS